MKRYRQVANILARHGFGFLLNKLNLMDFLPYHQRIKKNADEEAAELSRGERLRLALTELGATFIKFGQILSTRPDLVPKDIIVELEKLQDRVPSVSFEQIQIEIEKELGAPIQELFKYFDEEPLAAASIGQVHKACLKSGEHVVLKIRRPNINEEIETDLEILFDLARLAEKHSALGRHYNLLEIVEEFAWGLKKELDYTSEGRNCERMENNFAGDNSVKIPKVFWEYSTSRVLTMEYIDGVKLSNYEVLEKKGYNRKTIADNLARAILKQILFDGFFHADPHPGNIAVQENNCVCFMDFGLMGYLSDERKKQVVKLVFALVSKDSSKIVRAVLDMGALNKDTNLEKLKRDMDMLISLYYSIPLSKINFGQVLTEMLELAFQHKVKIPTELTIMAKSLITLEGVLKELDPTIRIVEIAEPFAAKLLMHKLKPSNISKEVKDNFEDIFEIVFNIPKKTEEILDKTLKDNMSIKIEHKNLSWVLTYFERLANKLSFSIVLLSFSIVMAGLVISSSIGRGGSELFWKLPILELAFISSFFMFVWLIVSIFRTGRF